MANEIEVSKFVFYARADVFKLMHELEEAIAKAKDVPEQLRVSTLLQGTAMEEAVRLKREFKTLAEDTGRSLATVERVECSIEAHTKSVDEKVSAFGIAILFCIVAVLIRNPWATAVMGACVAALVFSQRVRAFAVHLFGFGGE